MATFVALLSHVAGGGAMPGWVGIVVPWVLAVAVSTLLAGRSLSLWRLSLAVIASQFLFHGLFVLGLLGPSSSTASSPGLHEHHALLDAAGPMTGMPSSDASMWVGHAVAAVATIALLYRGERVVRRLLALAVDVVDAMRRRLVALTMAFVPVPRRLVRVGAPALVAASLGWFPSSLARRGPPALLAV